MRFWGHWGGFALLTMLGMSAALAGECQIRRFPAVPVTIQDLRPLVWAKINGAKARFIIDSGAFWSVLSPETETEYHLSSSGPIGLRLEGVNGSSDVQVTTVRRFTFLNVPFRYAKFFVGGNDFPSGAAGLLGGRLLQLADVEYDFGHGLMRFVTSTGCKGRSLAYWARGRPVGVVKLRPISARHPHLIGHALVNGKVMRVLFDTGSPRSVLTLSAARRAGITPHSPGVRPVGRVDGIGKNWLKTWVAPVALFQIGDEKIEHTHILVSEINLHGLRVDMVLGADFFLSHHIYVANRRHMLYFTYNGGPVFALGQRYLIKHGAGAAAAVGPDTHAAVDTAHASASTLMRRGMALAAEGQPAQALVYLNHACRLAPHNARYRFRRGNVYWSDHQPAKALADFDAAIRWKPKFYQAHLARAELLLSWKRAPAGSHIRARADINIVSLLAPDESVLRLRVASLYALIGRYSDAVRTVKLWLYYHHDDALAPMGWNSLCWIRAEDDIQLHKALDDCDRALHRLPKSAAFLDSRGLVYLRLGEFARSIRSYDAALRLKPHLATSLYGRSLDERREGKKALARTDRTAAVKANPKVARIFARMHIAR